MGLCLVRVELLTINCEQLSLTSPLNLRYATILYTSKFVTKIYEVIKRQHLLTSSVNQIPNMAISRIWFSCIERNKLSRGSCEYELWGFTQYGCYNMGIFGLLLTFCLRRAWFTISKRSQHWEDCGIIRLWWSTHGLSLACMNGGSNDVLWSTQRAHH